MVGVGGELESETRGIDVTRRAESIGEGIRVRRRVDTPSRKHPRWSVPHSVPGGSLRLHGARQTSYFSFNIITTESCLIKLFTMYSGIARAAGRPGRPGRTFLQNALNMVDVGSEIGF